MSLVVVGIADCQLSADPEASLVTYALGSCVGVSIHDPVAGVGGLLHILLPDSRLDGAEGARNPFKFADTGIPEMFHRAYRLGAEKQRLRVTVLGGSSVMDEGGFFAVGSKNVLAVRKILWRAGVFISAEDTGGNVSRTVRLEIGTGQVLVRASGAPERCLADTAAKAG